jgi:polysaccharide biosynthesis protein PslJ
VARLLQPHVRPGPGSGLHVERPQLPAWPVDVLLWGFPVYWLLGLTPFMPAALAGIMAVFLLIGPRPRFLPGVVPWFAFSLWLLPAALMLDSPLRLVGYSLRFGNVVALGIILVYVTNAEVTLPARRVLGGLVVVWGLVVVGGYLGLLFPEVRLTTPAAAVLPAVLTSNEYVIDLVSPPLAEVQTPWGATESFIRPSAPFPYANGWGSAVALFTPVAIAMFVLARRRWVRSMIAAFLAASTVPAVASLNRGMFVGLFIAIAYAIVRLGLRGKPRAFLAALLIGVVGGVGFVLADVAGRIAERQGVSNTTAGRADIYRETFERTLASPFLGYGAPRPSYTGAISIGTQGHVWMLMFSYGFVGLFLFLYFLWGLAWRTRSAPTTADIWLHSTIATACVIILFYGLDTMQMLCVLLCGALLLRSIYGRPRAEALTGAADAIPAP